MINEIKFKESKDFYLNGTQPTGEVYTRREFTRIVTYKIKYAILARKRKAAADKKYLKMIKKQLDILDSLEK
jgi:hypothetical protein